MTTTVTAKIRLRRNTASGWATANPILESCEIGFELVTKKSKVGDGVTAWNSLPYHYDPNDSGVGAAIAAHEAASNPHPVYVTQAEADATYAAFGHLHTGVYEPVDSNIQVHLARTDNPHHVTAAQVGADASGTATTAIAAHASATGVHAIAGVTGLQAALDGKAETTHNHTGIYDAAGTAVSAVAAHVAGTGVHSITGVTGLQTALDGKSATTHDHSGTYESVGSVATHAAGSNVHAIASVTGLQTALDGKSSTAHNHAASEITSGTIATARLGSGTADSSTYLRGDQTWAAAAGGVASDTHAATSKTVPVNTDELPLVDSEATFALKKLTWGTLKTSLVGAVDATSVLIQSQLSSAVQFGAL